MYWIWSRRCVGKSGYKYRTHAKLMMKPERTAPRASRTRNQDSALSPSCPPPASWYTNAQPEQQNCFSSPATCITVGAPRSANPQCAQIFASIIETLAPGLQRLEMMHHVVHHGILHWVREPVKPAIQRDRAQHPE